MGVFSKGGIYSQFFLEGEQPLFFSLGHCAHLIGRNRQQGWPTFIQAIVRCNGGAALNSLIQGKPNGLVANYKNLWVSTFVWLLHQWCPGDAFHMLWRKQNIAGFFLFRGVCAIGEAEIFAGTVVSTGGSILLDMGRNMNEGPIFSVSTCLCSSIYYSVGRRLPNPFNSNGEQDDDGEDLQMKKWSKIVGQIILVAAYWFQFSHGNPPDAFNPNKWLWTIHKTLFGKVGLKITPAGALAGFAY